MVYAPHRYTARQQTPDHRGVGFGVVPREEVSVTPPHQDFGWLPDGVGDDVSPNLSPGEGLDSDLDDSVREHQEDLGHVKWVELMGMKAKELTC